jgi:hypothetical protein
MWERSELRSLPPIALQIKLISGIDAPRVRTFRFTWTVARSAAGLSIVPPVGLD